MNQLSEVQLILMWTGAFKRTKENKVKVQANRIKAHLGLVCWLISMSTPSGHRGPRYSVKHSGCVCEGLSGEINIWAKQFAFPSEWGLSNLLGSLNRTKKAEKVRPRLLFLPVFKLGHCSSPAFGLGLGLKLTPRLLPVFRPVDLDWNHTTGSPEALLANCRPWDSQPPQPHEPNPSDIYCRQTDRQISPMGSVSLEAPD